VQHIDRREIDIFCGSVDREPSEDVVISFKGDQQVICAGVEVAEAEIPILVGDGIFGFSRVRFRGDTDGGVGQDLFAG